MTWDEISTKVLVDCGRCCCLCRRFKPIRLQVHHIVPRSEGGQDAFDNAIALCPTCHSDVHTKAPFTRRFTEKELKTHRDNVYRLVAEGKLPAGDESELEEMPLAVAEAVSRSARRGPGFDLTPAAIRVLVTAASGDGVIVVTFGDKGQKVDVGDRNLVEEPHNPRCAAEYRDAMEQLEQLKLIAPTSRTRKTFKVTHPGYLLADELEAEGGECQ
jgi:hypothetical protein